MKSKYSFRKSKIFSTVSFVVLFVYTLTLLIPLFWAFYSAFKDFMEFPRNIIGFPKTWVMSNWSDAFNILAIPIDTPTGSRSVYAVEMLLNSVIYSFGATLVSTATQAVVAYCVAKYRFKFGKILYSVVIITMLLPIVGALPSEIQMARTLGFYDNILGVFVMKSYFGGQNFLIMYATFVGIPWTYAESAQIDGAGDFTIFIRIMLPLAIASVVAVAILLFINYWNEYYTPMIYLPSMPTIAYGLYKFSFSPDNASTVPVQLAGCFIVCIPILIVFATFQKKIMGNVAIGGIKG